MSKIRVLVVDDSAFMRKAIKSMVESDQEIEVIGTARDGAEGVEMALALKPDLITMDIEMPRLDGLEATARIMEAHPIPIIMVSSLTKEGAKATLDALDRGAADFISKNLVTSALDMMKIQNELIGKIKALARNRRKIETLISGKAPALTPRPAVVPAIGAPVAQAQFKKSHVTQKMAAIAIGASTGGPKALQEVLANLPANLSSAFIVAVHMPGAFTGAFAERLNSACKLHVKEAENGESFKAGTIFISPGGHQTRLRRSGLNDFFIDINDEPRSSLYKPSVDITIASVADAYPGRSMGVILTGMGSDGREGMKRIKHHGGKTIAQSENTCTVYGMPKAVVDAGLADKIVPLELIAAEIVNMI